jgi:hypothetical protein
MPDWTNAAATMRVRVSGTVRFSLEAYEEAYQVLRESAEPRGKVILAVGTP